MRSAPTRRMSREGGGDKLPMLSAAERPHEFDSAFAAMARERAGALLVLADSVFALHRAQLQGLAAQRRPVTTQ